MPVDQLADHPLQGELYAPLGDEPFARLKNSLAADGQRDPIVVMPPDNAAGLDAYTILDGHQRRDAAVELGWAEVDVLVRHDLKDAEAGELDRVFLSFNFDRRQLKPLDQAAVLVHDHVADVGRPVERFTSRDWRQVVTKFADHLNMSPKNATRYVRIAALPIPIQNAFTNETLSLALAERVFHLGADEQEWLADEVDRLAEELERAVENNDPAAQKALRRSISDVVTEATGARRSQTEKPTKPLSELTRRLRQLVPAIEPNVFDIPGHVVEHDRGLLLRTRNLLDNLLAGVNDDSNQSNGDHDDA
jgi:ParB/RepB/Spo0J family partition protein